MANTFNAPPNTTLTANTVYWLVVSNADADNGQGFRVKTGSATADTGAAMGWSIGTALRTLDIRTAWSNSNVLVIFAVKGTTGTTTTPITTPPAVTPTRTTGRGTGGGGGGTQDEHGNTPAQATLVTLDPTRTASVPGQINTAADVDTSALTCPTPGCWSSRRVGRRPPWAPCGKMGQS